MFRLTTTLLLAGLFTGCASMRTTPMKRLDDDSYCVQCPANGVPITVKVPTHLEVKIYEQLFFKIDGNTIKLQNKEDCKRNLKVATTPIKTDKVIFVDPKRPGAGTSFYNMEFNTDAQMITQYESFVYDRTLDDSSNLVAQLVPGVEPQTPGEDPDVPGSLGATPGAAGNAENNDVSEFLPSRVVKNFDQSGAASFNADVFTRERVVAFKIFDINAADFESQLESFLSHHLNSCHDCSVNPFNQAAAKPQPTGGTGVGGADDSAPEEDGKSSGDVSNR